MISIEVTNNEKELLDIFRSLEPFERVEIHADKNGKADNYIVHRSFRKHLN